MSLRELAAQADADLMREELRQAQLRVALIESRMALLENHLLALDGTVVHLADAFDAFAGTLAELHALRDMLTGSDIERAAIGGRDDARPKRLS